jgi:hypothetical protein
LWSCLKCSNSIQIVANKCLKKTNIEATVVRGVEISAS